MRRAGPFALCAALLGCGDGDPTGVSVVGFDEALLLDTVARYRDGRLLLLNAQPVASTATAGRYVRVYASPGLVDAYLHIADARGPMVLPYGGVIVREVLDDTGAVVKLTAVARGAEGSNPAAGDLWFAATSPGGVPLRDGAGHAMVGALADCSSCHQSRSAHGYLFGLPLQ